MFFSANAFAQSDSKIWIGIDGSYWQKSIKATSFVSLGNERFGSLSPMVGFRLNQNWDLGFMVSLNSYIESLSPLSLTNEYNTQDQEDNIISQNSITTVYQTAVDNQLFGIEIFAKRNFQLSEKISFTLTSYVSRESGVDGVMNFYFPAGGFIWPCLNCLSIIPGPIEIPLTEENWRFGIDAAFAYQANNWMRLKLRANLAELRRQKLTDNREDLSNDSDFFNPFRYATRGYFGNYSDFG